MSSGPYRRHSCSGVVEGPIRRIQAGESAATRQARKGGATARLPCAGAMGEGCATGAASSQSSRISGVAQGGCKRHGPPCRKNMRPLPAEPSRDQVPGGAASRREPRRSAAWLWAPSFSCVSASPGLPWLALASPGLSPSLCLRPRPRGAADCSILYFTHEGVISRRTNLCCDAQSIAHIWRRRPVKRHTPCQQGSHNRPS